MTKRTDVVNKRLDRFLAHTLVYAVLAFVLLRVHKAAHFEQVLYSALGIESGFPLLRILVYTVCAGVYAVWVFRWWTGRLKDVNPMLLTIGAMFVILWISTALHLGDSGYHIDWHAGFALMLLLDMGLQRERKSVLSGFSWALLVWVLLHLLSMAIYPNGYAGQSVEENPLYVPEWLLGTRTMYFRITLSALGFEAVCAHACRGRWTLRTVFVALIVLVTVILQRGVTAIIGLLFLLLTLAVLRGHALPKWLNPVTAAGVSVLLMAALLLYQNEAGLVTQALGKDVTMLARTDAWRAALNAIRDKWLLGIGQHPVAENEALLGATHTHNQMIELLLHGGVMALLAYLGMIVLAGRAVLKYRHSAAVKTAALLLMAFLLMGTAEIFHNEPVFYPLFVLVSRADCLSKGSIELPDLTLRRR